MKIFKLQDRSENNIKTILDQLQIEDKYTPRAENMLRKSKNIAVISEDSQIIGLINFKFYIEKQVVFCPVHLIDSYAVNNIDIILSYIKSDFPDNEIKYCKLLNMFYNNAEKLITDKTRLHDRDLNMVLNHPLVNPIQQNDYELAFEEIEYFELLEIHQDAYKDEVPYAGEDWAPLLEYYLTCENHKTIVCRHQEKITGLCLTIEDDNSIGIYSICVINAYRNNKIGTLLFNFLFQIPGKSDYRLSVVESNINALSLYKRVGFSVSDVAGLVFTVSESAKLQIHD